jgi:hypothetical protein
VECKDRLENYLRENQVPFEEQHHPRSVAENPGSKFGSRAWDQETELQMSGKSRSVSQAGRRYV